MSLLNITGGAELTGRIRVQGAKNSVLPLLAATVLHDGVTILHNCPDLSDVRCTLEILRHLGCRVSRTADTVLVDAATISRWDVPPHLMEQMRSSVIFLGAIAARCGRASLSLPGGCPLGPRPVDLHVKALEALGYRVDLNGGTLQATAASPLGQVLRLPYPSVGATENAILAACGCRGTTQILGAAREPEILELQNLLTRMGVDIRGAEDGEITVKGGGPRYDASYPIMGDRIVAATYLCACAAAGGRVELFDVDPRHLLPVLSALRRGGCRVDAEENEIALERRGPLLPMGEIVTQPYPGFPTDAQPLLAAAALRAQGTTVLKETVFSGRFLYLEELKHMGARIQVQGRTATITGVPELRGCALRAEDLRGGAALTIAALTARGDSTVSGLHHIDRGYQALHEDLRRLGAKISRSEQKKA